MAAETDLGRLLLQAHRVLGYSPRVPIREGLGRFVAWYRQRSK